MVGLTGVLKPNGEFISCSYGNHGIAAKSISEDEQMACIYISSGMETKNDDSSSIIYFTEKITVKQLKWFFLNYFNLDKNQKKQFKEYLFSKK